MNPKFIVAGLILSAMVVPSVAAQSTEPDPCSANYWLDETSGGAQDITFGTISINLGLILGGVGRITTSSTNYVGCYITNLT